MYIRTVLRSVPYSLRLAFAASALVATQLAWAGDETQVIRLSEPVEVTDTYETFGAAMPDTIEPIELSALVENHVDYQNESVVVTARVSEVCRKKGCFFIAQDGSTTIRVSFKDYSFFVPTDISGRKVILLGELMQVELSEEQAAHLEEDLGSDEAAVTPGPQLEIIATSVRIPRS